MIVALEQVKETWTANDIFLPNHTRLGQWRRINESYLGDGVLDDLLVRHVALVADKQLVDALGGIAVNLLQPLLDVVERVHVGHIVDDADAVSATVVGRGDSAEAFLAGGIPLKEVPRRNQAVSDISHLEMKRPSGIDVLVFARSATRAKIRQGLLW